MKTIDRLFQELGVLDVALQQDAVAAAKAQAAKRGGIWESYLYQVLPQILMNKAETIRVRGTVLGLDPYAQVPAFSVEGRLLIGGVNDDNELTTPFYEIDLRGSRGDFMIGIDDKLHGKDIGDTEERLLAGDYQKAKVMLIDGPNKRETNGIQVSPSTYIFDRDDFAKDISGQVPLGNHIRRLAGGQYNVYINATADSGSTLIELIQVTRE